VTGSYSDTATRLTGRMREVIQAAADGLTAAQTAGRLGVSVSTIRTERSAALHRLGVESMPAAVARYLAGER